MSFIDVHTFDGKWKCDVPRDTPAADKVELYNWLTTQIRANCANDQYLSNGMLGLNLVITCTGHHPNFDPVNGLYADDILADICAKTLKLDESTRLDVYRLILEQMNDMYTTGQCPQGRTTRLYQVWKGI
jgi:hypothetical protein